MASNPFDSRAGLTDDESVIPAFSPPWIYCGTPHLELEPVQLRSGPLTMLFEPRTAFLRHIRFAGKEVLRGIYGAVRDRNWGTVPPLIYNLRTQITERSFACRFDARCLAFDIDFAWHGEILGDAEGNLHYSFSGQALTTFLRNRIGFCILHPLAGCAGEPCEAQLIDGTTIQGHFPQTIAPHQPFKNLRGFRHLIAPDTWLALEYGGDTFEMEDQRNWTDASFKTYCTPLDLPYPTPITRGTIVQQTVKVALQGNTHITRLELPPGRSRITLAAAKAIAKPLIGVGIAVRERTLSVRECKRLKPLQLDHLRVDLHLALPRWRNRLHRAVKEANEIEAKLHPALFLSDQAQIELHNLLAELKRLRPRIGLWLLYHNHEAVLPETCIQLAKTILAEYDASIPLAAGANANFAELNRHRPSADTPAYPCFSLNPQVHAIDNLTLVENLDAQKHAVATVWEFSHHPVVISPITLRPRFNAVAAVAENAGDSDLLSFPMDPRQMSLFGAGWTLGSLAALASSGGVYSLTYFETTGWRGLMEIASVRPLPHHFPSQPDTVFPVYHVLADIAGFSHVYPTLSSDPLHLQALTLGNAAQPQRMLLANLTSHCQTASVEAPSAQAEIRILDATNAELALKSPETYRALPAEIIPQQGGLFNLALSPYAITRLDFRH